MTILTNGFAEGFLVDGGIDFYTVASSCLSEPFEDPATSTTHKTARAVFNNSIDPIESPFLSPDSDYCKVDPSKSSSHNSHESQFFTEFSGSGTEPFLIAPPSKLSTEDQKVKKLSHKQLVTRKPQELAFDSLSSKGEVASLGVRVDKIKNKTQKPIVILTVETIAREVAHLEQNFFKITGAYFEDINGDYNLPPTTKTKNRKINIYPTTFNEYIKGFKEDEDLDVRVVEFARLLKEEQAIVQARVCNSKKPILDKYKKLKLISIDVKFWATNLYSYYCKGFIVSPVRNPGSGISSGVVRILDVALSEANCSQTKIAHKLDNIGIPKSVNYDIIEIKIRVCDLADPRQLVGKELMVEFYDADRTPSGFAKARCCKDSPFIPDSYQIKGSVILSTTDSTKGGFQINSVNGLGVSIISSYLPIISSKYRKVNNAILSLPKDFLKQFIKPEGKFSTYTEAINSLIEQSKKISAHLSVVIPNRHVKNYEGAIFAILNQKSLTYNQMLDIKNNRFQLLCSDSDDEA